MDDVDGAGDRGAMINGDTGFGISDAAPLSVILPIAAFGSIIAGAILCARFSSAGDVLVRSLLYGSTREDGPVTGIVPQHQEWRKSRVRAWVIGAVVLGGPSFFLKHEGVALSVLYVLSGIIAGDLVYRGTRNRARKDLVRRLESSLPTAMERVVMAVGAGLDIIPALSEAARKSSDPVSDIFRAIVSLSEGGLRVEHAIHMTADSVTSSPVKHALGHLALAYKQGGEVIRPLKELSDATQTHYQERVEEEIAKLPVRAVLPLILTFTGLIICFLTVPVVQVGASLERFADATR